MQQTEKTSNLGVYEKEMSEAAAGEADGSVNLVFPELNIENSELHNSSKLLKAEFELSLRKKFAFARKKVCFLFHLYTKRNCRMGALEKVLTKKSLLSFCFYRKV